MKKGTRLNKYLSSCGLGSRRSVEALILSGRISINGHVVKKLSVTLDINVDIVALDNNKIYSQSNLYYLILNKPKGYITTTNDEWGRPTVMELIPEKYIISGIYPVGRLDKDSEGLLLLTNDGEFAYQLTHPKFGIEKEYFVEINKPLEEADKASIEKGIFIHGKKTNPAKIDILGTSRKKISIKIKEGKKRQIRLSLSQFGYKVLFLKRTAFGPIKLRKIHSGNYRILSPNEVKLLKKIAVKSTAHKK